MDSSTFTICGPDDMETDWKIRLYPKGLDDDCEHFLSIFLYSETEDLAIRAKCKFSILDACELKQNRKFGKWEWYDEECPSYGFEEFIRIDSLESQAAQLLPNDSLSILCEVTVNFIPEAKVGAVSKDKEVKMAAERQENLQEDLVLAFSHREFTDVKIHCGGKVFDCHQFMLSARPPVFRAMFLYQATLQILTTLPEHCLQLQTNIRWSC